MGPSATSRMGKQMTQQKFDELVAEYAAAVSRKEACDAMFTQAQQTLIDAVERVNKANLALNEYIGEEIKRLNGPRH